MTTTDGAGLLRAVLLRPECDLARGVYADWLDEHDRPDHAEFVRVQVELAATADPHSDRFWDGQLDRGPESYRRRKYLRQRERELWCNGAWEWFRFNNLRPVDTQQPCHLHWVNSSERDIMRWEFRRGFVAEVSLTLGAFLGERCPVCNGAGDLGTLAGRMGCTRCSAGYDCRGTGTVEGVARRLFSAHPVTAVTFSDAEIFPSGGNLTYYVGGLGQWPRKYWSRLDGLPSRRAALDALSEVACEYGRERANLTNGGAK